MAENVSEILRRLIAGNLSQGGSDFASKMAAMRMGTPEQMSAAARRAQIDGIVGRGAERDRMLALEPNMMRPEDEFISVNPSYQEIRPDVFPEYPVLPPAAEQASEEGAAAPPQQGLPTGGLPPNPRALGMVDAMRNNVAPITPDMPSQEPEFAQDYQWQPEGENPTFGARIQRGLESVFGAEALERASAGRRLPPDNSNLPPNLSFGDLPSMNMPAIGQGPSFSGMVMPAGPGTTEAQSAPATDQTANLAGLGEPTAAPAGNAIMAPAISGGGSGGGTGGGTGGLPTAAQVSPLNPQAYDPETGTRPPEARALSIWDRMFGEAGTDRRTATGQALMQMGAAMMASKGDLGQALGEGIQAGLLEYDQTVKALNDEAMEAKKMGMEEEAHELNMAIKRLQLARAASGGGGGGARTSGSVENPLAELDRETSMYEAWYRNRYPDAPPEEARRFGLAQAGSATKGSIFSGGQGDSLMALIGEQ